jgi:hypothetical protein
MSLLPSTRRRDGCGRVYTERVNAPSLLDSISLEPSPAIDAYKGGIDRTLLRENLRLTAAERVDKMIAALRFAEAVRDSRRTTLP